ncbi:MAG: M48 family metallopeptidase [Humidesulfovibrio sp.]|uniref:M48 family metallopeptidase n=1 Tax=Humidesulfovibrio sp. TaxID=2910988 RepID=UPI0027F12912|nr:M48 family metallopeptidase [Humidesulfovibrio sp.]MDQ7836739.1 M48 family metallopeptidase [Humidesulfovibrio sp.]
MNRSMKRTILLIALCAILAACAKAAYTNRSQLLLISEGQETQLGLQAAQDVVKKEKMSTDQMQAERVKRVGRRIAAASNKPDYKWEFFLIEKDTVNAFCLPGGKVFVYTGILDLATTNDELAAIMGHEIAHALVRHGGERMSTALMLQFGGQAASIALGAGTSPAVSQIFSQAYGVGAQVGVLLPHSRTQESEADEVGMILAAMAGYEPSGAMTLWQKMDAYSAKKGQTPPVFLSTHPSSKQRIADIQAKMGAIRAKYYRQQLLQ